MTTAAENNASKQYLDSMGSSTVILDGLMSQLNAEQQQNIIDYASFLARQSKFRC
ncbi:MAG: hypothetical protein ACJA0I_000224 [Gammaproteobacteria bacterium]|jgi:hypothetical protein